MSHDRDDIVISAKEFFELETLVGEIVKRRKGEIVNGELDGRHWFMAILDEARRLKKETS